MKYCISMLLLCAAGVAFSGCPRSGGNENANGNESGNNLTSAQRTAVETGMGEVESLVQVFSTLNALADPRLALSTLSPIGTFGTCPAASFIKNTAGTAALISLDFDAGCSSLEIGNQVASGVTSVNVDLTTNIATVNFTTLVFDSNTVQGQLTGVHITDAATSANLMGNMTVNVAGTGQLVGTFDVTLTQTGRITINSADFTGSGGLPGQITLDAVIIDPSLSLNLAPFQGTASFDIPATTGSGVEPAIVTFLTETTQDGTVRVQVSGAAAGELVVPGLL